VGNTGSRGAPLLDPCQRVTRRTAGKDRHFSGGTMTDEEREHWEQAEQLAHNMLAQCDDQQIAIIAAAMTIMCRDFCACIGLEKDYFIKCLDKAWIEETVH
jgi:hypothetical protein